jgi:pimeloyl-ACP methyl ester carboxylesterase
MKGQYVQLKSGITLYCVKEGRGFPVVFLHGWPGYHFDWHKVAPLLLDTAQVIIPDLRGFGLSDKPKIDPLRGYNPEVLAQDIIDLLDEFNIEKVVLAAHDIGATVAQTLARAHDDRIDSLVLFNPPYPGIGKRRFDPVVQPEFWYQHLHNTDLFEKLFSYEPSNAKKYVQHFYEHWVGNRESISSHELEIISEMYAAPGALVSSIMYYRARAADKIKKDLRNDLAPIRQHTTVLWGEKDPIMKVEWADQLDLFFNNYSLSTLPDVGHFVPLEAPVDAANTIIYHLNNYVEPFNGELSL